MFTNFQNSILPRNYFSANTCLTHLSLGDNIFILYIIYSISIWNWRIYNLVGREGNGKHHRLSHYWYSQDPVSPPSWLLIRTEGDSVRNHWVLVNNVFFLQIIPQQAIRLSKKYGIYITREFLLLYPGLFNYSLNVVRLFNISRNWFQNFPSAPPKAFFSIFRL